MVAICHNSDVGDAWEWATAPNIPNVLHRLRIASASTTSSME